MSRQSCEEKVARMVLRKGLTRMHISFDPIAGRFPAVAAGLAALEQAMDQEMPRWPLHWGRQQCALQRRRRALSPLACALADKRRLQQQRRRLMEKVAKLQSALERFSGPGGRPGIVVTSGWSSGAVM